MDGDKLELRRSQRVSHRLDKARQDDIEICISDDMRSNNLEERIQCDDAHDNIIYFNNENGVQSIEIEDRSKSHNFDDDNQFVNTPIEGATAAVKHTVNVDSISNLGSVMQNTIKDMGKMMKTFSEVINDVKITMMQNKIPGKENESRSSNSNDNTMTDHSYSSHTQTLNRPPHMMNGANDRSYVMNTQYIPKLPPFNGDEPWIIWYNRFSDVSRLKRWNDDVKLCELLSRLQGKAAEFVYGQLPPSIRCNFSILVDELDSRFKKVHTNKAYSAQFSNRNQRAGESIEDYAAELKRLYDKAHSNRDRSTRCEDLLRRFLDGLMDDHARFHVEYIKDPQNIDEAMFEVVNFVETQNRMFLNGNTERKDRKLVQPLRKLDVCDDDDDEIDDDDDDNDDRLAQINKTRSKPQTSEMKPISSVDEDPAFKLSKLTDSLEKLIEKLGTKDSKDKHSHNSEFDNPRVRSSPSDVRPNQSRNNDVCYRCGKLGHFARNCRSFVPHPSLNYSNHPRPQGNNQMEGAFKPSFYSKNTVGSAQ